jgi:hypothetical protein
MKVGNTVFIPQLGVYGEIIEMSDKVKGLITKVKIAGVDGNYTIQEVGNLTVEAVILLRDIVLSDVVKVLSTWVRKVFSFLRK